MRGVAGGLPPGARAGRHDLAAFLRAAPAGFGTALAVIVAMPGAFMTAGLADIGAEFADRGCEFAVARQVRSRQSADCGAVRIEFDASRHHFYVVFLKACGSAVVACVRA